MTEILLVDHETVYAAGVAKALESHASLYLRTVVSSQAALEHAAEGPQDGIWIVARECLSDFTGLVQRAGKHRCKLILLLARKEAAPQGELDQVVCALRRGASPQQVVRCLELVAAGKACHSPNETLADTTLSAGTRVLRQLSPRQLLVVQEVASGTKNAEIARQLGTSEQVVKNMLREIYDMVGVSDRLELALYVLHHPELAEAVNRSANPGL